MEKQENLHSLFFQKKVAVLSGFVGIFRDLLGFVAGPPVGEVQPVREWWLGGWVGPTPPPPGRVAPSSLPIRVLPIRPVLTESMTTMRR